MKLSGLPTNKPKLSPLVRQRMEGSRSDLSYSRGVQMKPSPDGRLICNVDRSWNVICFRGTSVGEGDQRVKEGTFSVGTSFIHRFIACVHPTWNYPQMLILTSCSTLIELAFEWGQDGTYDWGGHVDGSEPHVHSWTFKHGNLTQHWLPSPIRRVKSQSKYCPQYLGRSEGGISVKC